MLKKCTKNVQIERFIWSSAMRPVIAKIQQYIAVDPGTKQIRLSQLQYAKLHHEAKKQSKIDEDVCYYYNTVKILSPRL